ncbi:MAG: FG-GAP-like repeat-containing protein [Gammaproteobacteria bacterium]|nr:FG-GAP-like repeat-containing protein [Gammaproteobacteria bacterium]
MIEDLVAEVAAHGRDGGTTAKVQAPPSRDLPPSPADSRPGEAQRRPPPDGYAYATFERAGIPTRSGDTGDEEAGSPQAPEWLSSPDSLAAVAANAEAAGRDWSFGWVRLGADARLEDASAELDALGVVVEGQAGDLLRARLPGDPGRLRAVGALAAVDGLGAQPPSAKLPAAFAQEARVKPAHEIVPVFVTLAAADDGDGRWRAALERLGAVVGAYDAHTRSYTANVEYGGLDALAAADFVAFVEPVGIVEAANDTAVPAMGADAYRTYTDAAGWGGTAGQGVAVGVMDTGLNINHLDIETGRLSVCGANFVPSLEEEQDLWVDAGGHGTHVTATIAGSGAAERRYAGMAPLVPHIRFAKVLNLRGRGTDSWIFAGMNFLAEASSCGAAGWTDDAVAPPIVNMSLSAAALIFEGRDAAARKLDAVVWDTGQLYVVANANSDIHGFANYGAAKNSLPVGAAWDSGELASLSSHGPTADGRLVPLVVGTGVYVYSARGDGSRGAYVRYSGTSMSSPSVAGIAALVMDAQPDLVGNAALARAHLMASAVKPDAWLDAEDAFPSDNTNGPGALHARYGLGKVSGTTSVFDRPGDDGWESGGWHGIELDAGETSEQVIDVPPDASRLDVVLTWDEPSADVIANTVLNDLDLWLEPPFPASSDAHIGSQSRRDNVEWVIVRSPRAGNWRVRVEAERVHGEKPRAALAYTIIRGPATPQLSIAADRDTLGTGGDMELTVSTDGYVAAGTRLVVDCRGPDDGLCHVEGTYEEVPDDPHSAPRTFAVGRAIALGEIRAGEPRTLRFRFGDLSSVNHRFLFTATGWNAGGDSAVVFSEMADVEFVTPANDDFVMATELEGPVEGDLLAATTEPAEPAFEDGTERPAASVWYRWTAKADGAAHFSLTPAKAFRFGPHDRWYMDFETRVDVYQGASIAGAQPVASAPWGASFLAEQGTDYLVRIAGRARAVPFRLSFREGGAPENDAFDAAVVLQGQEGQVEGTNAGGTLEPGEQFGPLAATVWYEWTAPDHGWYEFGSSAAHLKVLAFEDAASVGDVRLVSGFPQDDLRFPAKEGDTYRIAVASQDAHSAGVEFELSWRVLEDYGSSNDLLENASAFPPDQESSRWVSVGRDETVEPGEPVESGVRSAWWSWTPPAQGEYTWRLDSDRVRLTAFKGDALDVLQSVGSNDGPTGEFSFEADEGEQYRFSVAAAREHAFTERYLGVNVVWGPTPSNDTWSQAAVLDTAAGTIAASNRYATIEEGEHIHDVGHSSLWWSFEAPAPGWYRFWIDEASLPFTVSVYADDPGAPPGRLEMIASSRRGIAVGIEVFLHARHAGERFAVRAGTLGYALGRDFTLRWEASEPPVWLRYAGRTDDRYEYDDAGETVEVGDFRSLAFEGTGRALYAGSDRGLAVFEREEDDGSVSFVDLLRGGDTNPRLLWDAPRNRLLAFKSTSVRSYVPVGGDVLDLEDDGDVAFAAGTDPFHVDPNYSTVLAHPTSSFLYFVGIYQDMQVFSVDEDGVLAHVQTGIRVEAAAVSNDGGHVFAVRGGLLSVFESGDTGELTEVASLPLPHADEAVAVADDDSRVFTWGRGGSSVVAVDDPARPELLGTVALPREGWWSTPVCRAAVGRNGPPAADAFCTNGDAYALAWRDGQLAVTDLVADWATNRYNDVVPDFGSWWSAQPEFAASPDGRYAYAATRGHGIAVFERVGNEAPEVLITVTIAADASPVGEGMSADFTLTRSDSAGPLTVNVAVMESGAMIEGTAPPTMEFADGETTAALSVPTEDDALDEPDSVVTATVLAGTGYAPGVPDSATVTVTDDDMPAFAAERVIATGVLTANWAHAADLDGDGDPDVLSASYSDDEIAWYENLGHGDFSAQRAITTDADGAGYLYTADLDGDGDPDVLSTSGGDDRVAWYENQGSGAFSTPRIISTLAYAPDFVLAADFDGDGDADVLAGDDIGISWYENEGGEGFSSGRVVRDGARGSTSAHAVDLDGDGDADVLSASFNGQIAWHENVGGGEFAAQRTIAAAAGWHWWVHAADLDGDGDADVLAASSGPVSESEHYRVVWHENLGGGQFSAQRVITVTDGAEMVATADADGDGDLDVLAAFYYDDQVGWYENLGGGAFSERRTIATGDDARSVHPTDLDGDGDADVLVAWQEGNKIAWYENLSDHGDDHGDEEESATLATALPAFLHGVLESDGDNDVFRFATGNGTLKAYANGPTNTYGWLLDEQGDFLAGDDPQSGNFLIEAEVEAGVHYVDVFGPDNETGPYTLSIEFVSGDDGGPGADDHGDTPATATALSALPWFGTAELDADSDRDVFRIDVPESGMLTVYTTDAGGGADTYGVLTDANGTVLAEDDNSGDGANFEIEVAVDDGTHYVEVRGVADQPTGYYYLFIELTVTGEPTVAIGDQQVISTDADGAVSLYAADLDDDGVADVLSASRLDDKIAWYENLNGDGFSAELVITTDADGARAVHAADLDGDGDADVLSGSYDDDKIAWYENQGGAFSSQRVIATRFPGFVSVHAADLDGDGDADVLGMSGDLEWYENLGDDGFSGPRTIGTGGSGGHGSVHAADLDGDGDQDVLSAGHANSGPGIAWYENGGDGSFSRHDFGGLVDVVYAADLDGDGDPDVVVAHGSSNVAVVAWHENLGDGTFSAERPITTLASGGQSVHAADIDGDGDMDVLSASYYDGKIAWYSNRGDGSFLGQHVIAVADGAESVHSADIDGDGDPDVLSASQGDDTIAWYENLSDHGDDHGDTPEAATLAATLPALLLGKVDSSGDKDVFRVATGSGTLRLSTSGPTDTLGRLLDANGEQLARNDDSDGLNFGIEAAVAAGVHYVEVGGYSTRTGPYTLSIEFEAE